MTEYAKRNVTELDEQGGHYWRHMTAMTRENLNSKSDIAAELAWRDCEIARMKNALEKISNYTQTNGFFRCEIEARKALSPNACSTTTCRHSNADE